MIVELIDYHKPLLESNLEFIQYVQSCLKKMYPGKYIFHRIPSLYGTYATKYDLDHRNKCQMVV